MSAARPRKLTAQELANQERQSFLSSVQESFSKTKLTSTKTTFGPPADTTRPVCIFIPMGTYFYTQAAARVLYDYLTKNKIQAVLSITPWPGTEKIADEIKVITASSATSTGAGTGSGDRLANLGRDISGDLLTRDYPPDPLELSLSQATLYPSYFRPDGQELRITFERNIDADDLPRIRQILLEIWKILQDLDVNLRHHRENPNPPDLFSAGLGYCLNSGDSLQPLQVVLDHPTNPALGIAPLPDPLEISSPFMLQKMAEPSDFINAFFKTNPFSLQELLDFGIAPFELTRMAEKRNAYETQRLAKFAATLNKLERPSSTFHSTPPSQVQDPMKIINSWNEGKFEAMTGVKRDGEKRFLWEQILQSQRESRVLETRLQDPKYITQHVQLLMFSLASKRISTRTGATLRRFASFIPGVESLIHSDVKERKSALFQTFSEALLQISMRASAAPYLTQASSLNYVEWHHACEGIFTAAVNSILEYQRHEKDGKLPISLIAADLIRRLTAIPTATPRPTADLSADVYPRGK